MTFKTTSALCALAFSALAVSGLQAQTTPRDAAKTDTTVTTLPKPAGEMSVADQDKGSKPMSSTNSRDTVKSDAKGARAAGQIPSGEASTVNQGKKPAPRRAESQSRAKVKADTANAGGLSRGQQSVPNQDRGGIKP